MSNTKQTPTSRAATKVVVDGITFASTDKQLTATLPDRKKVVLSLVVDLDQLFALMRGVSALDDDADIMEVLAAMEQIMPDEFREAVKGVDAAVALRIFMHWVQILGERLGKAFT